MKSFSQKIVKLGINPCVNVPDRILSELFRQAGKATGPVPVRGKLNGKRFKQTVVKYQGAWRLYLNTQMRLDAGIDVGDHAKVQVELDTEPRVVPMHPTLARALAKNKEARDAFENLSPSRRKEVLRYLHSMKTQESVERNTWKVIGHLLGKRQKGLYALMHRQEPGRRG